MMIQKSRVVLFFTAVILFGMLLGSAVRHQERAVSVTAVTAEEKPIYNSVTAGGTVEAERSYAFCAKGNAAVSEVYCKEGGAVQTGDALWRLEPIESPQWTAELLQTAFSVLTGSEACERVTTAVDDGGVIVYAPASCTLLTVPAVGQSAPAGLPYATAADLTALRLRADIAETFVADVRPGQRANITVSASGSVYSGKVESVAPVAKQAVSLTGTAGAVTVAAILRIQGADEALRPGYSASAKIFVDEKPAAVVLPYEAIRQEGETEYVYVIDAENRLHRRTVETGYALSQAIEILDGVTAGERIVLEADGELTPGTLVEVRT